MIDLAAHSDDAGTEPLTLEQAISHLGGDDLGLRFYAAWWLGKFRVQSPAAVDALIVALQDEDDRTDEGGYPLRRNAARALGKLADCRAVPSLVACLDCSDFYVREAAAQSLELLGDRTAIPTLVSTLQMGLAGTQLLAQQPDLSQPYDAVLEALGTLQAVEAQPWIEPFLNHPTHRVQYAAARALYQITGQTSYGDRLVTALDGDDLQLRRAALADLGAIGYLPGAAAIAATLAENSLKLIALRGVLIQQLLPSEATSNSPWGPETNSSNPFTLSEGAIQVMTLMDSLL
jgi:phycocyanobilin lyase subunit alpha